MVCCCLCLLWLWGPLSHAVVCVVADGVRVAHLTHVGPRVTVVEASLAVIEEN
jgi:hypothetical protein